MTNDDPWQFEEAEDEPSAIVPKEKVDRRVRWQRKQLAAGRCVQCGTLRNLYKRLCDHCQAKRCHKWKPGKPGRPPNWSKISEENDE